MRSTLLVSTAVLLAGIGLASAQNTQSGGQSGAAPSAQSQGGAAGQERQSPQSSPSQRGVQSQQGQKEPMQKDTTGQAQQRDQAAPSRAEQRDQAAPSKAEQKGVRDQQSPTQAQSPQRQQNGQAAQSQAQQGSKTLTTEQRTTIRKTVLSGGNVPRATNVNFNVSVGTTVPTSVRVVAVPSTLIEIYPEWRGHMYFVVNDEIIIVDSNHRIVAVIAV